MSISRKRGATLSLVVGLTFVLVIIGVACFFLLQMIGGSGQLQHATDSGNLNVAKTALVSPYLSVPNDIPANYQADVQENFSTVLDTAANGSPAIDLLTYNRLVGQAFLIAMNAAADGSDFNLPPNAEGIAQAKHVINVLNDPTDGIGSLLAQKLKSDPAVNTNFLSLAQAPVLNMLGKGTLGSGITNDQDISYLCQPAAGQVYASNVSLSPNVIPTMFQAGINGPNFVTKNINGVPTSFVVGYAPLSVPGVTDNGANMLMGVPLRPGEEPHIVNTGAFNANMTSPAPAANPVSSCVPPNAFKSAGLAFDPQTRHSISAISCAVAGCLNAQYSASLPGGFIVIANGPGTDPTTNSGALTLGPATAEPAKAPTPNNKLPDLYVGAANTTFTMPSVDAAASAVDIFSTILMPPNGIYVSASSTSASAAITKVAGVISGIETTKFNIQQLEQQIATLQSQLQQAQQKVAQGPGGDSTYANDMATINNNTAAINNTQTLLNTANNVTLPALIAQLDEPSKVADAAKLPALAVPDQVMCTNVKVTMDPPGSACPALLAEMESVYGGVPTVVGKSAAGQNVSAIEWLKASAIAKRASGEPSIVDPSNPANGVNPPFMGSACSGVDAYSFQDYENLSDAQPPTLNNLLGNPKLSFDQYNPTVASDIVNQITKKLYQMQPTATTGAIQTVLNTPIPSGSVRYIWLNTTNNQFQVTDISGLPSRINPNTLKADGTTVSIDTGSIDPVDPTGAGGGTDMVDVPGEQGYEHPYDCQTSQPSADFRATWTPSSGTDGLEGILRFVNCVNIAAPITFTCPC